MHSAWFKSADGGANWTNSITPPYSGCEFGDLGGLMTMDPTDPNTLYARVAEFADDSYGLLKSTDGGANWKFTGLDESSIVNVLAIDPASPATIYAATDSGVFKSTDGGAKTVAALAQRTGPAMLKCKLTRRLRISRRCRAQRAGGDARGVVRSGKIARGLCGEGVPPGSLGRSRVTNSD